MKNLCHFPPFKIMSTQGRNNLFPVGCTDSSSRGNTPKLDWLENKSFTSHTAEKVVEFQQELKKLQKVGEGEQIKKSEASKQGTSKVFPVVTGREELTFNEKRTGSSSSNSSPISSSDDSEEERVIRKRHRDSSSDKEHEHKQFKKKKKRKHRSDDSDSNSFKKKKYKKKKNKKQKKGKLKSREKLKDSHTEIKGIFSSNKIFLDEVADIAPEHPFKLDRIPDNNSWTYGSMYSGHVASYKPACNQCVGTKGSQMIFMKDQIKKEKVPSQRYYSKENRKMVQQLPLETITKQGQDIYTKDRNTSHSFIPVQNESSAVKSVDQDVRQQILDSATSLYVQGKGKTGAEAQTVEETNQDPLRRKVAEYNKQLRESPTDVKLWLQFVKFQDKLSEEGNISKWDSEETGKSLNARGILEKKLSILDKALEANPGNIDLLLAKVELNAEISDSFKINKELDQLLFVHPANADLWKYYLTFNQTRLSVFTVTKTTKLYQKCFKTITGILEGRVQTHTVPQHLERKLLDIFCQYCYFLKQAGYKEKAIASFQALLEFNLFAPSTLSSVAKETKMAAFMEFWESNVARIGMAGAKGWKTWFELKDKGPTAQTSGNEQSGSLEEQEEVIIAQKHSKHITWLKIESRREQNHWLPWHPGEGQTEEDCEDVERLVMFDDVSPVLFSINEENNICHCVNIFLNFLGFHSKWDCFDNYINFGLIPEYLDDLTPIVKSGNFPDVLKMPQSELLRNVAIETLKLAIPVFSGIEKNNLTLTLCNIKLIVYREKELSKQDKKEMRAIMKSVLKEEHCRNNLFIWSAYIDLERVIGKPGEAKAVGETALAMNSGSSVKTVSEASVGLLSLYSQYCDILVEMTQSAPIALLPRTMQISMDTKRKVLAVLGCMVEAEKFKVENLRNQSGAVVLKTLSSLSKMCDFVCKDYVNKENNELERKYILKVVWCFSLYTYCKSDLKSSLDVYANVIAMFSSSVLVSQQFMQQLHMDRLRLIVHHMSRSSSPLHILRGVLDSTLSTFPDNPVFLSLFLDIERKSRISGRINLHFDRWCRNVGSPSPAVCGVVFQLGLLEEVRLSAEESNLSESGLVHRARGWLEHSLSHSNLQHCPLLWRLYLKLEEMSLNSRRQKGVFYRAMQQCPWAKSIYIDGVRLFGTEQLQEIVDLMTEKEIRVQLPVEELDILNDS